MPGDSASITKVSGKFSWGQSAVVVDATAHFLWYHATSYKY